MNSGLPSLLDAIFGKQELGFVSLDEIYELITEFPSFNAGHFLLSKKLKEQQESGYEKETMRTALYFNNPFWLESVLNEESHITSRKIIQENRPEPPVDYSVQEIFKDSETNPAEPPVEIFPGDNKLVLENESPDIQPTDSHKSPIESTATEESYELQQQPVPEQVVTEYTQGPVKSFDDLISKYHIESLTTSQESPEASTEDSFAGSPKEIQEQHIETTTEETHIESQQGTPEQNIETTHPTDTTQFQENIFETENRESDKNTNDYEIREEVVNDYGIFEEIKVKKTDFDFEDFDKPVINGPEHANLDDPTIAESKTAHIPDGENSLNEKHEALHDGTDKNEVQEELVSEPDYSDYEAFDPQVGPQMNSETERTPDLAVEEESISEIYSGQDHRLESVASAQSESERRSLSEITENSEHVESNDRIPDQAETIVELQIPPLTHFDPKKAESIVFAPYHMIDYFASQGIKLNLEENPTDPFAKQLKSFTDWLKVMKKLPAHTIAEKTDEREVDRIRHFAAHSIDEREILTESMAEVLAKQGMYENAIALFQKLSLIYPPKSAYFASRIEQIKASLP